jgi:hypothetical protein
MSKVPFLAYFHHLWTVAHHESDYAIRSEKVGRDENELRWKRLTPLHNNKHGQKNAICRGFYYDHRCVLIVSYL